MNKEVADYINILGQFCGVRDVPELSQNCLIDRYGFRQADVMVLFGGSILCGGDVLAQAMREQAALNYIIVGGAGHTTETLRQRASSEFPSISAAGIPEAEIFNQYLHTKYGLYADYLECKSTNCGNNITYLLNLLQQKRIPYNSIILCQDATMQRRMDAGLRKHSSQNLTIINYAAYHATVIFKENMLSYSSDIYGMWEMDRYISLLMGEIPRLTDNKNGYGPLGKNFIAHVDIPDEVSYAFHELEKILGENQTRSANPMYASENLIST